MSLFAFIPKPPRVRICREAWPYLIVLAVVAGAAMFREINLLMMLAGMIAGPIFLSWWVVAANLRGLRVERRMPHGICAGDLLVVNLELASARRRASWAVAVEERISRDGQEPLRPKVYFPYVGRRKKAQQAYRGRLVERGEYQIGPLRMSTRFPFGLLQRTVTVGSRESLVVFPRLGRLMRAWNARHQESFDGVQQRQQRFARVEEQFFGVRYWQRGDSRRSIHWRSSARQDQLVVRQYEQPRNRDVALLLDLWQPDEPTDDQRDCIELAVSFAATIVADYCRKGNARLLVATTAAPEEITEGPASTALMQDCMRQLAIAGADSEDRLPRMLESSLRHTNHGNEIILISTREVNLEDHERFERLRRDPVQGAALRRIRVIRADSLAMDRYFQIDL